MRLDRGRRAAVGFILVSVGLDTLSLGVMLPVLSPLVQWFEHGDAAAAGRFIGLSTAAWAVAQFLAAPVLGALSDRFGRRPVLLISLAGLAFDYLLMAAAPSLAWLFVGRVVSGLTSAGFAVANAYIADVTPPEKRAAAFGLTAAAFGVGFILGPSLGGLLGAIHIRLPFVASAALTLCGVVYGAFVLPESLSGQNRAVFSWAKANPLGSLAFLAARRELLGLAGVSFLMQFAHNVLPTLFILYASNRYGWSLRTTGLAMALVGVCSIVVQALVVRPVVARIGEWGALLSGLTFGALGFAIWALAPSSGLFFAGIPVFGLMGLFGPGYQGLITRQVAADEQGRLQGANAGIMGLAGVFAPITFGYVYAWSLSPGHAPAPGAGFLLASALTATAAVLALTIRLRRGRTAPALA